MPNHTYQQQKTKKRKNVYLYVPKNLRSKKRWTGKGRGENSPLKKRQRQRLEAKALKEYQRTVGLLPKTRIKDPQTTKELCQDSLGILEEISEHGINDHRYLQLSNHLMSIHKKAAKNEDNREEDFYYSRTGSTIDETEGDLSPIVYAGSLFDHVNPYANMQTDDLIRNYIQLATGQTQ